ncbi:MAG: DUF2007 domain-containing protein [Muribaculaceae bacterium]|nr:DUF2007 domain-containing protein [Muribaculaceae bacterium]
MKRKDDDEIVFLGNYMENITDAYIAKQVLEEHGIPSMIFNETISSVLEWGQWSLPQIMVFKRDVEEAVMILSYTDDKNPAFVDNIAAEL